MDWIVQQLWLIPALPLVAGGLGALVKQRQRRLAASLAIGSMGLALALSCVAFINALQHPGHGSATRQVVNFFWFQFGDPQMADTTLRLGWVLDPLSAVMLVMVSLVGLLIFIYRLGHARAGHCQQPAAAVHLLGNCRSDFLPADRLLVSQTERGCSGEEGLHH